MNRRSTFLTRADNFFSLIGAANAVAGAVQSHQRPRRGDLERLGINPDAFPRMR